MKRLYITCITVFVLLVGGGIFYVSAYKKITTEIPAGIVMEDITGTQVALDTAPKKLRLVEFIYTNCPDVCPITTLKMKSLRDELVQDGLFGKKVEFVTITIDPARDTKDVLQHYANTFEMKKTDGWYMLRGNEADTKKLAEAFNFLYRDPGDGKFIHTSNTYLLDQSNQLIAVFGMGENGFDNAKVISRIKKEL